MSCSVDTPNEGANQNQNQELIDEDNLFDKNLPEESRNFVGYWLNTSFSEYRPHVFLSSDGICFVMNESMSNKWNYDYTWYLHVYQGYWGYDSTSRVLATTASTWQFNITFYNGKAWSGSYKTYTQSLEKASNLGLASFLIKHVDGWLTEDNEMADIGDFNLVEDENTEDYTFKYSCNNKTGIVKVKNPLYLSKVSLIFEGDFNYILHRNWQ